jgi:hypothetical protein
MRQAVSMLIDRELIIDVDSNRPAFAAEGINIKPRYHTVIGAGAEVIGSTRRTARSSASGPRSTRST